VLGDGFDVFQNVDHRSKGTFNFSFYLTQSRFLRY
jgi:hypothetical protein